VPRRTGNNAFFGTVSEVTGVSPPRGGELGGAADGVALGSLVAYAAGQRCQGVGYGLLEQAGVAPAAEEDHVGVVQVERGGLLGGAVPGL
jgi:hypothetical protein